MPFSVKGNGGRKLTVGMVVLIMSAFLLFYGLHHYALWDDEALTALSAKGILRTGDTTAFVDHNIVAFREGISLKDSYDRSTPPLSAYLAAVAMHFFGEEAWAARLPFAAMGLFTVGLFLWWLWRRNLDVEVWLVTGIAILGNVSFFLYFRQCRYYGPAIFFSLWSAYLYLQAIPGRRRLFLLSISLTLLFASSSINYTAFVAVMGLDYLIWGRKEKKINWREASLPIALHLLLAGIIGLIWNPLQTNLSRPLFSGSLGDRLNLIWLIIRDMNRCEFFPALFFTLVPLVGWWRRDTWLWRGGVAFIVYVLVMSIIYPQDIRGVTFADVRYLVPLISLCIALTVRMLMQLFSSRGIIVVAVAFLVCWTNVLNEGGKGEAGFRSTVLAYGVELFCPPPESYTPTANWIKGQVKPGQSVWVIPPYKMYPLMFHAPHAIYAWQFPDPPPPAYAHLPPIHIWGRILPDFIVAFGPVVFELASLPLIKEYAFAGIIPFYWQDLYRPELFWRTFRPVKYDKNAWQEVYIFRRRVF